MSEKKKTKAKAKTKTTKTAKTKAKRPGRPPTGTVSVTWRLPVYMAEECAGDWTAMREVLDAWAENPTELDPEIPEECKTVTMRVHEKVAAKLEKEAARLSKLTNRKRTAGWVARRLYEDADAAEAAE
jgi:hypothetical protein